MTVVDGTVGSGGHAKAILEKIGSRGILIALDYDPEAITRAREVLEAYSNVHFFRENFKNLDRVMSELNIPAADAVILDVGFSSDQLEDAKRGISYDREGPLDMRLNADLTVTAADLVNRASQAELERLFWEYGQDRFSRRFAARIVDARRQRPLQTTKDLLEVLRKAVPGGAKRAGSFRTGHQVGSRVFQALRIAVNHELENLEGGLPVVWDRLRPGGRLAVISFHSLEDKIVKIFFKSRVESHTGALVNRKPMTAGRAEASENPRSRSAKLRITEKIA